jgi:hypothetical protein
MKGVKGESRNAPGEHIKCYAGGLYGPIVLHSLGCYAVILNTLSESAIYNLYTIYL